MHVLHFYVMPGLSLKPNLPKNPKCYCFVIQPTLIEGILEGEFEGSDVDAAVTVMREFRKNGAHRLPARDFLMAHGSFYRAIENNSSTVISHLNNNNSQVNL